MTASYRSQALIPGKGNRTREWKIKGLGRVPLAFSIMIIVRERVRRALGGGMFGGHRCGDSEDIGVETEGIGVSSERCGGGHPEKQLR